MDSGSSGRAADAVASLAKKAAPAPAPAPTLSPENKEVPAPAAWGPPPAASGALAGVPVMGGAEYWPALSGGTVMPAAVAAPMSNAPPAAAARPAPIPTRVVASIGNPGVSRTNPGDRAAPAPVPERPSAFRKQSPAHTPNHRSNGGAPAHRNGRSPLHPHDRSGHNGGGSRRGVGGGISIGNANGNDNGYGSGGGVRHGQKHRGYFDGQHRGRGHQDGHGPGYRHLVPHMPFGRAPHPFPAQLPPPPPLPFFAPPMSPPFYGAYYGPMIGYTHPEFAPGFYIPPPRDELHFMPYPALPVHVMLPHLEQQQAAHPHMEENQAAQPHSGEQQAAQPHVEEQQAMLPDVEEPEAAQHIEELVAAQLKAEKLETDLRDQIDYYFSENNLCKDPYLKQNMDAEGWVPLTIIAGFRKVEKKTTELERILKSLSTTEDEVQVKKKTTNLELILKSVLSSTEVEVQDGKIRRRTGWEKYLLRRH